MFRNAYRAAHAGLWWSSFHRFTRVMRSFVEQNLVIVAEIRPRNGTTMRIDRRLPKQCRNIGIGAFVTQRAVHHCAVNVKGAPAKPQYPLRGSDGATPSLMGADLWSPIATPCNPTPGIGRNSPSSRDAGAGKTFGTACF